MTVSTRQDDVHCIHVLDYVGDWVVLTPAPPSLTRATLVKDGSPVELVWKDGYVVLRLSAEQRDEISSVVRLM